MKAITHTGLQLIRSTASTIVLGVALLSQTALAQSADDASADDADGDIIVTAQKRSENVQNVPVSIAAFTGEMLTKTNVVSVQDIGRIAPNFTTTKAASVAAIRINIRGVGAPGNTATEPSVAVFLDGVYIPRSGSILGGFLDIEGAEVLRGPQGTLFGRNASVGALSLHSATPKDVFAGRVTGEVGSYQRYKLDGYVNVPLSENVAVRVAGMGQWFKGFWNNRFDGNTYGGKDEYAVRGSLKAQIGALDWIVRGDYSKTTGDGVANLDFDASSVSPAQLTALQTRLGGQLPDTNLDDRVMNHSVTGDFNDRQWGVSSQLSLDVGGGTLRLIDSYRDWNSYQLDGDVLFMPRPLLSRVGQFKSKSHNHELQFISPVNEWLGGRLDMVTGLYYFQEDYRLDEQLQLNAQYCNTLIGAAPVRTACNAYLAATGGRDGTDQDVLQNTKSIAAYGQLNFKIAEPLTLVLGGRWTQDKKNGSFAQRTNTTFAPASLRAPEVLTLPNISDSRFTYRVGLNLKPSDNVLIFGSFSTGYKSGGYNSGGGTPSLTTFDANGAVVSTKRVFGRETVNNYELGIKSSWLDRALTANLTLYRMDIDGYQDRSYDGVSFIVRNAGSLRHQGFEFDTVLRPVPRFSVSGSVAYLDSKFTSFVGGSGLPGLAGSVQNLTGTRATFTPEWSGRVGFDWTGDLGGSGMTWGINSNLSFISDFFAGGATDNNPQTIQDGYILLGARLTLNGPDGRWTLAAFANNLTNTAYANLRSNQALAGGLGLNNGVFPGSTAIRSNRGDPRTYGVSASISF